jgi:hypothetical protein
MSAEELYAEKQRFIAASERRLRRAFTSVERDMLALIYERIIDKMITGDPGANHRILTDLARIHREFIRPANVKIVRQFASDVMTLPERSERLFSVISEGMAGRLADIRRASEGLLRARLGLTSGMNIVPGGYLQSVIEDPSIRNKLQGLIQRAIDDGGDFGLLRTRIREYVIGTGEAPGALTQKADQQLFDAFMDADRSGDKANADMIGLQGAVYDGGLIETSRQLCCELNGRAWTRDEMEALNAKAEAGKKWSGWKGDIMIYCGGHNCRHGWNWVSNTRLLRLRKDLELVPGTTMVRYKVGIAPQSFNAGCTKAERTPRKAERK